MIVEDFDFNAGIAEAKDRANSMISHLYSRFGLKDKERLDKAELGCMGEIAFEHWLRRNHIAYKVDRESYEDRNTDEFDFMICGRTIDVKVAKLSTNNPPADHWCFGVPVDQHPDSKDALIVGWIDFRACQVGFYGWISGVQVGQCPKVIENSLTHKRYLTLNYEFRWGDLDKNIRRSFGG